MRCKLNNVCIVAGARTDNGTICTTVFFVPAGTRVWDFAGQRYGLTGIPAWGVDRMRDGRYLVFFDRELIPIPPLDETIEGELASDANSEIFFMKDAPKFPVGSKFWDVEDKAVVDLPDGSTVHVSLVDGSTAPFPRTGVTMSACSLTAAEFDDWLRTGPSKFDVEPRRDSEPKAPLNTDPNQL